MEKKIFRFCEISSCKHRLRLRISSSGKAAKARTKRQEPGEISMWKTRAKRLGAVLGLFSIGWTVFDWHQDSRGFWAYQGLLEFENSVMLNCSLATCWASSEESCIHPTQPRSVRMGQGYISFRDKTKSQTSQGSRSRGRTKRKGSSIAWAHCEAKLQTKTPAMCCNIGKVWLLHQKDPRR